ncbi:MAG: DUF3795 domain-containing protein [Victivallales bacterium]|nr:DUF3795 domain-containing protein [Victivallales bacterium]
MYACCGNDCERCEWLVRHKTDTEQCSSGVNKGTTGGCQGCMAPEDEIASKCPECAVRRCCRMKNIPNCFSCSIYPCVNAMNLLKNVSAAEQFMKVFKPEV